MSKHPRKKKSPKRRWRWPSFSNRTVDIMVRIAVTTYAFGLEKLSDLL
jgi:hypothetical protein